MKRGYMSFRISGHYLQSSQLTAIIRRINEHRFLISRWGNSDMIKKNKTGIFRRDCAGIKSLEIYENPRKKREKTKAPQTIQPKQQDKQNTFPSVEPLKKQFQKYRHQHKRPRFKTNPTYKNGQNRYWIILYTEDRSFLQFSSYFHSISHKINSENHQALS